MWMERVDENAPVEKKLQKTLESLGVSENAPSILLVVHRDAYPSKGASGLKDQNWKSMTTHAKFYVEAHLDPANNPSLPPDEVAQRRGWIADLVEAGIKALGEVHRRLESEGAGVLRVEEVHYYHQ